MTRIAPLVYKEGVIQFPSDLEILRADKRNQFNEETPSADVGWSHLRILYASGPTEAEAEARSRHEIDRFNAQMARHPGYKKLTANATTGRLYATEFRNGQWGPGTGPRPWDITVEIYYAIEKTDNPNQGRPGYRADLAHLIA